MCQSRRKGSGEITIFSYGISVGYLDNFDDLSDLNVERIPLGGSMKLLTTFVGRVLPLSGRKIHGFPTESWRAQRRLMDP